MKNKGLVTILILIGLNIIYYAVYAFVAHQEIQRSNGEARMIFVAIAYLVDEFVLIMFGYILLLLKLEIGRVLLAILYTGKACIWSIDVFLDFIFEHYIAYTDAIQCAIELLFAISMAITLILSKNISDYIKSRKKILNK